MLKLDLFYLRRRRAPRQVKKLSQPLFLFSPGLTWLARVAALTWPPGSPSLVLFLHNILSWPGPSPQPCVEQNFSNGPVIQVPQIADYSLLMRAVALARSSEVKLPPRPLPAPLPEGAMYSASRASSL